MKIVRAPLRMEPKFYEMIRLAVAETQERLIKADIATPEIRAYLNGCRVFLSGRMVSSVGVARPLKHCIALNARLLAMYPNEILTIVVHEVCHLVAFRLYGERGHGKPWKKLMVRSAVNPCVTTPLMSANYGVKAGLGHPYAKLRGRDASDLLLQASFGRSDFVGWTTGTRAGK